MVQEQENVTMQHIQASNFRAAVADSAQLSLVTDALGTTFHLTFTRLDLSPISETFPAERREGGGFRQMGPATFDNPPRKVQEFAVMLRPDHAFQVAQLLLQYLSQLDEEQKKRYSIPEIAQRELKQETTE